VQPPRDLEGIPDGEITNAPATARAAAADIPPTARASRAPRLNVVPSGRSWSSSKAWAPIPIPNKKASTVPPRWIQSS
jgi:hypothetical protein